MNWDILHRKAKAAVPSTDLVPRRYWIAVLLHDRSPENHLEEGDLLWMKAHGKITYSRIVTEYAKRHPGINIEIAFMDRALLPTTCVKDLNYYSDNFIVFRAQAKLAREPLQPIQCQLTTEHRSSQGDKPSNGASLQPLQHQVAIEPRYSQSDSSKVVGKFTSTSPSGALSGHHVPKIKAERRSQGFMEDAQSSFNPEDCFKRDLSPNADDQSQSRPTDEFLRQLIDSQHPEILEAGVVRALNILESLQNLFSQYVASSQDAEMWIKATSKLAAQAERKRTVVGVVGNTGAGKSSVINALLDEERLVPTNCMRACTAVVTEISWNDSKDPLTRYRAEIEFITPADWEKELDALMKEFLTDNGTVSKEASDQNSDAGIAWAKFRAVYPRKTKDMLRDCTVAGLMAERSVLNVLGATRKINKARPDFFYQELQKYVDSKEKATKEDKEKKKDKNKKEIPQMEYWPLIKVVKIFTKSPALSTGAVIVDLPGVHDSNAARAAVAQGYMKQCTGLWIVAPITRAVDDKAAKTLLGDSFKRQLKYDGGFSSVTFVCSKTDDISITEAIDSLALEEEISALEDQEREYKKTIEELRKKIQDLVESKEVYKLAIEGADKDIEIWDELQDKLNDGATVYAPNQSNSKRKRENSGEKSRKLQRARYYDSDDDMDDSDSNSFEANSDSENDSDVQGIQPPRTPLTGGEIKLKLEELRSTKKNARRERSEIIHKVDKARKEIRDIKAKLADIRAEMSAICIAGRNEYSKGAIQQDFAAGIKELDQENAAEEDEETFNPDEDLRDYDEVAKSLPVFCVSSRAYQKMCGRLQKDDTVPGFKTREETEIPQLQAHCKKLTEAGRIQTARTFLLNLCQQLTTFYMWASNDGSGLKLSDNEKRAETKHLDKRLGELDKGLGKAVESCIKTMKKEICEQIFEKYPEAIEEAIRVAPDTVRSWGAHKQEGGLAWATYKAIVRRDGVYTSSSAGLWDFNTELSDPIIKRLANSWERAFQNRLPKILQNYSRDSGKILHRFHDTIEERARQNGVGLANLQLLKNQIYTCENLFAEFCSVLVNSMNELQRDANREFTPTIVTLMRDAYEACTEEHGAGSFKRMKAYMEDHVQRYRFSMFKDATQTVQGRLNDMCKTLEETMAEKAEEIFLSMRQDYMNIIGGANISQDKLIPRAERAMRADILSILLGVDEQFKAIANGEIEDKAEEQTASHQQGLLEKSTEPVGEDGFESKGIDPELIFDEPAVAESSEAKGSPSNCIYQATIKDSDTDKEMEL
ncbi:uncharacterized protein BDR25DRAFT_223354 [Lindgomyces ingoldianus]|uniref:Uncharacterized protein n=1 Tax=Lindgomyces ingoldianus TaxID=673940 RepID=A0ACB6QY18_9PLEO|nr:uncharacterized protein BDR25DRAFT_223354 [Lindgomyces ingoldianus]KAF2471415.1 hypothetical protein BDR25DRAFT_223354 [Lindgomyces ingoldianus]